MCRAIHTAKNSLDLDMDSEVGLNRQRRDLAEVFRHMAMLRNSEKRPLPAEARLPIQRRGKPGLLPM